MTFDEKVQFQAKELFKSFYSKIFEIDFGSNVDQDEAKHKAAKECAIMSVDEILDSNSDFAFSGIWWHKPYKDLNYRYGTYEDAQIYWLKVKEEITKI